MPSRRQFLTTVRERAPTTRLTGVVFAGDLLVLLAFASYGMYSHGTAPWSDLGYTFMTFAPFAIAWVVLAPLLGVYLDGTLASYRQTAVRFTIGWPLVAVVGSLVRATPLFHGGTALTFVLVTIAFGLLFFLVWRFAVVTIRRGSNLYINTNS